MTFVFVASYTHCVTKVWLVSLLQMQLQEKGQKRKRMWDRCQGQLFVFAMTSKCVLYRY